MRNVKFAVIKESDLITVGSEIKIELQKLVYSDKVFYEKGAYHIQGLKHVKMFKATMLTRVNDVLKMFTDAQTKEEAQSDINFIKSL